MSVAFHHLLRFRARLVLQAADLDVALARDLLDGRQVVQSIQRRTLHVVRIGRPQALRENIAHARALEHRANRGARDHAGSRRGGLHQHATGAVLADDLVRNRAPRERDAPHVATRGVDGLAHRLRHFVRLARGHAHLAAAIADGDERIEAEAATTLHDLGDAIDRDAVLEELAALAVTATSTIATPPSLAATRSATTAARAASALPAARSTAPAAGTT